MDAVVGGANGNACTRYNFWYRSDGTRNGAQRLARRHPHHRLESHAGTTADLAQAGAEVVTAAADAAQRAALVVTMVTDVDAVLSIACDEGMLASLAPGAIWAQMSTIGVAGIDKLAELVANERPDITLLDAPVSGSKDPAAEGQLTIFASGPDEANGDRPPRSLGG